MTIEQYVKAFDDKLEGKGWRGFDEFAQKEAIRDLEKRRCEIVNGTVVFNNGVARWTTNNQVVPMECAVQFKKITNEIDLELHQEALDGSLKEFFANYVAHKPTAEEKAEMDANFEAGEKIVDVITGEVVYISKGNKQ